MTGGAYESYLAGCECLERGDYASAIRFFSDSCKLQPHFKSFECLYRCYLETNETDKAFECISAAYRLNFRNDKTAFEYAKMLNCYKRDREAAEKVLREILSRNSSFKAARELLDELEE